MNKVKITDIAQKKAVFPLLLFPGILTIRSFFHRKRKIKIKEAIKDLNYSQNNLARILVTGQSNLVGVIFLTFI